MSFNLSKLPSEDSGNYSFQCSEAAGVQRLHVNVTVIGNWMFLFRPSCSLKILCLSMFFFCHTLWRADQELIKTEFKQFFRTPTVFTTNHCLVQPVSLLLPNLQKGALLHQRRTPAPQVKVGQWRRAVHVCGVTLWSRSLCKFWLQKLIFRLSVASFIWFANFCAKIINYVHDYEIIKWVLFIHSVWNKVL